MNQHSQPPFGKISVHGDGMGAPTPELVENRAREIALIDERNPDEFTDADWDRARRELLGVEDVAAPEDNQEEVESVSSWDEIPGEAGARAPRTGFEDDESVGEHLVVGGLEEAAHDQMLEARKEELTQEGGTVEGA